MWRSQTLPRLRPLEGGPPLPPRKYDQPFTPLRYNSSLTGTLSRQKDVDVQRLREDIDTVGFYHQSGIFPLSVFSVVKAVTNGQGTTLRADQGG